MILMDELKDMLADRLEDKCDCCYKPSSSFVPIIKNGRIAGVAALLDEDIWQVFTDNSDGELEEMLIDCGFRDFGLDD